MGGPHQQKRSGTAADRWRQIACRHDGQGGGVRGALDHVTNGRRLDPEGPAQMVGGRGGRQRLFGAGRLRGHHALHRLRLHRQNLAAGRSDQPREGQGGQIDQVDVLDEQTLQIDAEGAGQPNRCIDQRLGWQGWMKRHQDRVDLRRLARHPGSPSPPRAKARRRSAKASSRAMTRPFTVSGGKCPAASAVPAAVPVRISMP